MIGQINGETSVFGITGNPVGHSLSPLIHNAAFQYLKINAVYVPFPIKKPNSNSAKALLDIGVRGLSVTIPHKVWAMKTAVKCDDLSELCEASNTLIAGEEGWSAWNTDGPGALTALKNHTSIRGRRILLIGYGGSATAIAHTALLEKEKPGALFVYGRSSAKAKAFSESLINKHKPYSGNIIIRSTDLSGDITPEDIDIIIHTTPLGMQGASQELPLPEEFIREFHTVFDIVYIPALTPLVRAAKKKGASIVPGYLMLLYQAGRQFELFTGEKAPVHLMEKELLRALKNRNT